MAREATHDIFEQNLFAYYLMALAVSLVLLDVSRGRIRRSVLAWLAAVTLVFCVGASPAFDFVSWGGYLRELVPLFVVAPLLLVILVRILRGDASRDMLPWLVVVACALLSWPTHADPLSFPSVTWFWQGVLVVPGVALAAGLLLAEVRRGARPSSHVRGVHDLTGVEHRD